MRNNNKFVAIALACFFCGLIAVKSFAQDPPATPENAPQNNGEQKPKESDKKPDIEAAKSKERFQGLIASVTIFVLAIFVGFEVITKVPPTLHTPLMSGSNAISGITIVGAIIAAGTAGGFASFVGMFAVALAIVNVVGGFMVTQRMLAKFKKQ